MDIQSLIWKSLTTKIAPLVYVFMVVSMFRGMGFILPGLDPSESVLYASGTIIDPAIWGWGLTIAAGLGLLGLIKKWREVILVGTFGAFVFWTFAAIALAMEGNWYVMLSVALFHMLYHGYVYLTTSLGLIERQSIPRKEW